MLQLSARVAKFLTQTCILHWLVSYTHHCDISPVCAYGNLTWNSQVTPPSHEFIVCALFMAKFYILLGFFYFTSLSRSGPNLEIARKQCFSSAKVLTKSNLFCFHSQLQLKPVRLFP